MKKLSKSEIQRLMRDELKAYYEYTNLQLFDLADDEKKHYQYFKNLLEDKGK